MEDQFVPFEQAIKLKELGFDEDCFGWYNYGTLVIFGEDGLLDGYAGEIHERPLAPIYQQAFDFLLKKYYLYSVIIPTITMYWTFKTTTVVDGEIEVPPYKNVDATDYSTYEEARQACLEKLIELCKSY